MENKERSLSLTFVRGARSVTGANFLLEAADTGRTARILVDCGLKQGARFCESGNSKPFPYDPKKIDAMFVTHAHADHIGLIPKLVKDGFRGPIYGTAPTIGLASVMLADSASLIAREAKVCHDEPPYIPEDVEPALQYSEARKYGHAVSIGPFTVTLFNAGHILGSALVLVEVFGRRILFTGDLGRTPAIIVPDPEPPKGQLDYLITESVYGNRVHEAAEKSDADLLAAIRRIQKKRGTLLIPSFSLERTQIVLAIIDRAITEGKLAPLPVFLDSPLAIKVTELYKEHHAFLREDLQELLQKGDDPFSFPSLNVSYTKEDSKAVNEAAPPKVIIAGAGMSHGGRVRSHERIYLPGRENELLLVGYQVPGSLGRRLQDGAREVTIDKKKVKVRAKISKTGGFSAHADRDDLVAFAEAVNPKEAFVVLGEMESSAFLAQRLSGFLGIKATVPQEGERVELL
ncbi:MAG: MBL fold metallo-hydrolase [Candidatus Paceibacteria bacterium]